MSCPNWVDIRRVFHYASQLKSGSINIQYRGTLNKMNPGSYFILGGISDPSSRSPAEESNLRSLVETTLGTAADGRKQGDGEFLYLGAVIRRRAGILRLHSCRLERPFPASCSRSFSKGPSSHARVGVL